MPATMTQQLLDWYQSYGRDLPWRIKGGAHPNPYIVMVSEVMLQQTTVKTVIPYFQRFIQRFPKVEDLATADIEEVYRYWQGLGYYSRARSLQAAAQMIITEYNGIFPKTRQDVLRLKGIGNYTASSFLALAFNLPETVVDGNVVRVISRLYHLTQPVDEIKTEIKTRASKLTSQASPADYASAIMDLGALVCTPKNPQCLLCPWQKHCLSKDETDLELIPVKQRLAKREKEGFVYLLHDKDGRLFIRKRTEKGLLSGLYEFPWSEQALFNQALDSGLSVCHIFTHFRLNLKIYTLQTDEGLPDGAFISPQELVNYPMSTLMKKVYQAIELSIIEK